MRQQRGTRPVPVLVLAAVAILAACGARSSVSAIPATQAAQALAPRPSGSPLSVTVTLVKPALRADTLALYAYRLLASGPLSSLPGSSRIALVSVANGAARCATAGLTRTCTFSPNVPAGSDVVVALLASKKRVVGQSFVQLAPGQTALALMAGNVSVASLTVVPPAHIVRPGFNVAFTAFAQSGAAVMLDPSASPIEVRVYGPPGVVPAPRATVSGLGMTASFPYRGAPFSNPMTVTAVTGTMSNTGQIYPKNPGRAVCAPLGNARVSTLSEPNALSFGSPSGFFIGASVAGAPTRNFQIDTGSTGTYISKALLTPAALSQMVGPGQVGMETLHPSGDVISGNYYLAKVTLYGPKTSGSFGAKIGTTVPMEILVVTSSSGASYMGVGFGRPTPPPSAPFLKFPTDNVFLQLLGFVQGSMHPGFVLTSNSLSIGLNTTNAANYAYTSLTPFPGRLGDWNGPPGCVAFNGGAYQCGNMLVDVGIDSMFITAVRPTPLTSVAIAAPTATSPSVAYSFAYPISPSASPPAPNPRISPPIVFSAPAPSASPFVNTGRDLLAAAGYLYDPACGRVGFKAAP